MKQILLATHSTEIIRVAQPARILEVPGGGARYLSTEAQKIKVLAGIGAEYAPRLQRLQSSRRLLLLESDIDQHLLQLWSEHLAMPWPNNVVSWSWSAEHKERNHLISQLKIEIPCLKTISLRDRDNESDGTVGENLVDKNQQPVADVQLLKWRRHIENYLLCPPAIARAAGIPVQNVQTYFQVEHGLAIPPDVSPSDITMAIRDAHGKELFDKGSNSIAARFAATREKVAGAMTPEEAPKDVRLILERIQQLASVA